jgi:plastocyanin
MKRLAGIATAYALVAALVLVAPLSAADPAAPPAPSPAATAQPEAASEPAAPAPVAPAPEQPAAEPEVVGGPASGAPAAEPGGAPPAEPGEAPASGPVPAPGAPGAPPAEAVATPAAEPSPDRKRSRDRALRATAAADTSVTIRDFAFAPASVTVDVGDTVTWANDGPTPHTATADDGSFDTGLLNAGESGSHTFEQAGTFRYFCQPHPNMRGTVTVRAASQGGDGAGGGGETSSGDAGTSTDDETASDDDSGAALPATGLDAGGLALLGLMTLALGAWLRRRASAAG